MTARRLLGPVAKTLLDAANLIEEQGWWDGNSRDPIGGRLCADLAIGEASGGNFDAYNSAYERLSGHLGRDHIPRWNDNEARSGKAVCSALRAAAVG